MRRNLTQSTNTHCAAFTLVETIVVVALFSILSLAIANSIHALYRYNAYTFAQAYQVQNARTGVQALVRDMREMTFADNGAFPLVQMDTHQIAFYSDIDRDDSVEYVEYELISASTLEKRIYNATGSPPVYDTVTPDQTFTLSEYVQNYLQDLDTFTYYDGNGEVLASSSDLTNVRYIEARLIINIDPTRDPGEYMLRSSAALRNVKENL